MRYGLERRAAKSVSGKVLSPRPLMADLAQEARKGIKSTSFNGGLSAGSAERY